jgi:restriction endonuclease S subunit
VSDRPRVALGEIADLRRGVGLAKADISADGSLPCVHYGELFTKYGAVITRADSRTSRADLPVRSRAGDVLMPTSDVTPRGLAKASAILEDDVVLGGDILVIRPRAGRVHGPFLARVIRQDERQVLSLVTGSTVHHLYAADMAGFALPLPPFAEQVRLAESLADADAHIAAVEGVIAKKRAIRHGMLQQLLTGRTRLAGFASEWPACALGELGSFQKGRGITRDDVRSSGVPCVRYGELYTTYRDYTSHLTSCVDPDVAASALPIRAGDLLFAGSGETRDEIGVCVAYLGERPAVAGGDIVVLRGAGYDPVHLACLLNAPDAVRQKARLGQGDAVVHIGAGALAALRLRLPPPAEQEAIAAVVVDADREIEAWQRRLAKARAVQEGMLQELLPSR